MNVRIKTDLPLQRLYEIENPPAPQPLRPRREHFEREQRRMDRDKKLWFTRMAWGMWTVGK